MSFFADSLSAAGVFFGDGDGGRILGSLARKDLMGVDGLGALFETFFLRRSLFVVTGTGEVSSGRFTRFNLRRTSYTINTIN